MKAVVIYEAGGVDKLIYQDVETPKVKPGWSLVKVKGLWHQPLGNIYPSGLFGIGAFSAEF
mgnify:CR=1 FL=1